MMVAIGTTMKKKRLDGTSHSLFLCASFKLVSLYLPEPLKIFLFDLPHCHQDRAGMAPGGE
jgi:hypothetical protein